MQVIKFKQGKIETLLDSGPVDLAKLGKVSVSRASEILFDEDKQQFYVKFLRPELQVYNAEFRELLFPTYKAAVAAEIEKINHCYRIGVI